VVSGIPGKAYAERMSIVNRMIQLKQERACSRFSSIGSLLAISEQYPIVDIEDIVFRSCTVYAKIKFCSDVLTIVAGEAGSRYEKT
jgi:hypothetical protein